MFELDFFGLINGAGVEFLAFWVSVTSICTVMMGLIWPFMERLFQKWDIEELAASCQEIDAELLEKVAQEITILEKQERALMWHISPSRALEWSDMAWNGLVPIIRRREALEATLDFIWNTPIILE